MKHRRCESSTPLAQLNNGYQFVDVNGDFASHTDVHFSVQRVSVLGHTVVCFSKAKLRNM